METEVGYHPDVFETDAGFVLRIVRHNVGRGTQWQFTEMQRTVLPNATEKEARAAMAVMLDLYLTNNNLG